MKTTNDAAQFLLRVESEMLRCEHFNGAFQHDNCKAGVNYHGLVGNEPGCLRRLPCLGLFRDEAKVPCTSAKYPSREEAEVIVRESDEGVKQTGKALELCREDAKRNGLGEGSGGTGAIVCPKCNGTLRYSVASVNGHLWGKCATKNCLAWMQ